MPPSQNEDVTWDDMDWGDIEDELPSPATVPDPARDPQPPAPAPQAKALTPSPVEAATAVEPVVEPANLAKADPDPLPGTGPTTPSAEPPATSDPVATPVSTPVTETPAPATTPEPAPDSLSLPADSVSHSPINATATDQQVVDLRGTGAATGHEEGKASVVAPTSLATLRFSQDGGDEVVVTVKDQDTVGRRQENQVVIKDLHVSGKHAQFVLQPDGGFQLVDLGSSGGSFVNDEAVQCKELASGDQLTFGTVAAVFQYISGPKMELEMEFAGTLVQTKKAITTALAGAHVAERQGVLRVVTPGWHDMNAVIDGEVKIGRAPDNELVIGEVHVSNYHATLVYSGGRVFKIIDHGSSCGTFVNDVQLVGEQTLNDGDSVRFGAVDCLFAIEEIGRDEAGAEVSQDALPPDQQLTIATAKVGSHSSAPNRPVDASPATDIPIPKPLSPNFPT